MIAWLASPAMVIGICKALGSRGAVAPSAPPVSSLISFDCDSICADDDFLTPSVVARTGPYHVLEPSRSIDSSQ
jgi:hypothetical protein